VPNWSGHVDFLDSKLSVLLPGQLTKVHKSASWKGVILDEAQWFTVNYNYASAVLKDMVNDYQKYLINAKKLARINKEKYSFEKMSNQFETMLQQYVPDNIMNPPEMIQMTLPNLPKLDKVTNNASQITLPKLQKEKVESVDTPALKLPKLTKVNS
jgi:hypothetical protein